MTVVVLFDVDGTLLTSSADTHIRAFGDAFVALTGASDPFVHSTEGFFCNGTSLSGHIDSEIARICLQSIGISSTEVEQSLPAMLERTVQAYHMRLAAGDSAGCPVDGVVPVLQELRAREVPCGLLTGNARQIAAAKLAACRLDSYFAFGAYGDEANRRRDLFPRAVTEAARLGIDKPSVCYVGDTPRDVAEAREAAVAMVAVSTGRFGCDALYRAGASIVLEGYQPTDSACDTLIAHARTIDRQATDQEAGGEPGILGFARKSIAQDDIHG